MPTTAEYSRRFISHYAYAAYAHCHAITSLMSLFITYYFTLISYRLDFIGFAEVRIFCLFHAMPPSHVAAAAQFSFATPAIVYFAAIMLFRRAHYSIIFADYVDMFMRAAIVTPFTRYLLAAAAERLICLMMKAMVIFAINYADTLPLTCAP